MSVERRPVQERPPMSQPCPVCGGTMREYVSSCASCALNSGCDLLCCENCGYESVAPKSATVDLARKIIRFVRGRSGAASGGPERS